jgi:YD repeat-containing protein
LQVRTPEGAAPGQAFAGFLVLGKQEKKHFRQLLTAPLPVAVLARGNTAEYSHLTVYSEIAAPLLMGVKLKSGTHVDLVGEKDAQGNATSLEALILQNEKGRTNFLLDEIGRPAQINLPDGSTLRFTWDSNTQALAELVSADGSVQANVSLDLSSPEAMAKNLKVMEASMAMVAPLRLPQRAPNNGGQKLLQSLQGAATAEALAASSLANIFVQVTANGQPVSDAVVNGLASPGPVQVSYPLFFTNSGAGAYHGYFVTDPAAIPLQQASQSCISILDNVEVACSVAEPIAVGMVAAGCLTLSVGIAAVAPEFAAGVLLSCESVFADAIAVCAIGGQPNISAACGAVFAVPALLHPGTITLRVSASKSGVSGSRTVTVPSSGGPVNISIDLPLPPCAIMSVSTDPVDPAPGQGYTASTVTTCANPGDSIGMSVSGTDGYSDSTACPGVNSCELFVPGAEEGVVDTVTVTTSNGESRLIQLVF